MSIPNVVELDKTKNIKVYNLNDTKKSIIEGSIFDVIKLKFPKLPKSKITKMKAVLERTPYSYLLEYEGVEYIIGDGIKAIKLPSKLKNKLKTI